MTSKNRQREILQRRLESKKKKGCWRRSILWLLTLQKDLTRPGWYLHDLTTLHELEASAFFPLLELSHLKPRPHVCWHQRILIQRSVVWCRTTTHITIRSIGDVHLSTYNRLFRTINHAILASGLKNITNNNRGLHRSRHFADWYHAKWFSKCWFFMCKIGGGGQVINPSHMRSIAVILNTSHSLPLHIWSAFDAFRWLTVTAHVKRAKADFS